MQWNFKRFYSKSGVIHPLLSLKIKEKCKKGQKLWGHCAGPFLDQTQWNLKYGLGIPLCVPHKFYLMIFEICPALMKGNMTAVYFVLCNSLGEMQRGQIKDKQIINFSLFAWRYVKHITRKLGWCDISRHPNPSSNSSKELSKVLNVKISFITFNLFLKTIYLIMTNNLFNHL